MSDREVIGGITGAPLDTDEPPRAGGQVGGSPVGEHLGSSTGEFVQDVIVEEKGGWSVFSEGAPRKRLGGPYSTKAEAHKRLAQVEWFKAHGKDSAGGRAYIPPPGPGTAAGNHAAPDPVQMWRIMAATPARAFDVMSRRVDARKVARKRLPRQIPPRRIEEDYATALVRVVNRARAAYAGLLRELPKLLEERQAAKARGDHMDAGEGGKVRRMVAAAAEQARRSIQRDEIDALARKFAERTSTYQRLQFTNQVRAALGVDPIIRDKGLAAATEQFTHENVALVVRIPERLHGDLEAMVQRAVSSASPHPALADQIEERFGVAERHARLIARDQVSKFHGSLNHARQRELGVEKFVWRTVGDERVRDEHEELDGEVFSYDDPPSEGLPSEPVLCRCSAEPIFEVDESDDE